MKVDINKNYKTREGCRVKIYEIHSGKHNYPVHGCIFHEDGSIESADWTLEGTFYLDTKNTSVADLVEAPPTVKYDFWVAMKKDGINILPGGCFMTEKACLDWIKKAKANLVPVHITGEVGIEE